MYTGTMIDELISSVERAEQHAREQQSMKLKLSDYAISRMELQELIEVA